MLYSDARPLIRSGDIISYRHKIAPWRSWYDFKIFLVRLFTTSDITHVGVAWAKGGRVMILEAVSSGVRPYPLSLTKSFRWTARGVWSDAHEQRALSVLGQKYSYAECGQAVFGRLDMNSGVWQCAKYLCFVLGLDMRIMTPESVTDYFDIDEDLITRNVVVDEADYSIDDDPELDDLG